MIINYKFSIKSWFLPLVIIFLTLILQWGGLESNVRYDRIAVEQGAIWRIFTSNYVHLGWAHYVMNMAGLVLIWILFGNRTNYIYWILSFFICSWLVGLGIHWFNPEIIWYVGLSGVLHGLFVVGLYFDFKFNKSLTGAILVVFLVKLVWEQLFGAMPGSEASAGGNVIVDAHLYGAIGGLFCVLILKVTGIISAGK